MKRLLFTIFTFITISSFSQNRNLIDHSFIEISGRADTLVAPNKFWINILLTEKDLKGKKTVENLKTEMMKKLKELGIDTQKNLRVNNISANYKSYNLKKSDVLKSKSYSIIVTDAKIPAKIFVALEEIGISNVRIEKFANTDEKKIKFLMNARAILNAKQNAESYAKPLNQKIGNALHITTVDNASNKSEGKVTDKYGVSPQLYGNKNSNYEHTIGFEKIKISSSVQVLFSLE